MSNVVAERLRIAPAVAPAIRFCGREVPVRSNRRWSAEVSNEN